MKKWAMEMKQSQVFRWAKWGKSYKLSWKGLLSKNSFLHYSSLERCHFRGLLKYLEALRARREFGGGEMKTVSGEPSEVKVINSPERAYFQKILFYITVALKDVILEDF